MQKKTERVLLPSAILPPFLHVRDQRSLDQLSPDQRSLDQLSQIKEAWIKEGQE